MHSVVVSFAHAIEDLDLFKDNDDYFEAEIFDFADIAVPLRLWLRYQDGLKIHGVPLTNRETLESRFALLDRGRTLLLEKLSAEYLARMVEMMYIKKITRANSGFKQAKAIPGDPGKVVRLNSGGCRRPVLDDNFPFFTSGSPDVYIIEVVRISQSGGNGCGQSRCKGKPGLVPANRAVQDHTRMETRSINQTTRRN